MYLFSISRLTSKHDKNSTHDNMTIITLILLVIQKTCLILKTKLLKSWVMLKNT